MRVVKLLFETPIHLTLLAFGLSLLAAIFWWYFFKTRNHELTTKNGSILMLFLVGMIMVVPLALVESSVVALLPQSFQEVLFSDTTVVTPQVVGAVALVMFLIAGTFEELSKMYFLRKIMPLNEIDQVIDSIKFGIAIGIGFAIVENALFLLSPLVLGNYVDVATTFFLRFFFSTLAHAVYSGMAGYFMGLAKFEPWKKRGHLVKAIFLPILAHGLFNTLLLVNLGFYALPLILVLFAWMLHWYGNAKNAKRFILQTQISQVTVETTETTINEK